MQEMKTLLLEEVRTKLYSRLRETASEIVREVVQREIAERVRRQVSFFLFRGGVWKGVWVVVGRGCRRVWLNGCVVAGTDTEEVEGGRC